MSDIFVSLLCLFTWLFFFVYNFDTWAWARFQIQKQINIIIIIEKSSFLPQKHYLQFFFVAPIFHFRPFIRWLKANGFVQYTCSFCFFIKLLLYMFNFFSFLRKEPHYQLITESIFFFPLFFLFAFLSIALALICLFVSNAHTKKKLLLFFFLFFIKALLILNIFIYSLLWFCVIIFIFQYIFF